MIDNHRSYETGDRIGVALDLPMAAAVRLARHAAGVARAARRQVRLIRHDDEAGRLGGQNLSLIEAPTAWWLLENNLVLARAAHRDGARAVLAPYGIDPPAGLGPRARFSGTLRDIGPQDGVDRHLWQGGADAQAPPGCCLVLHGPVGAVMALAVDLAASHAARPVAATAFPLPPGLPPAGLVAVPAPPGGAQPLLAVSLAREAAELASASAAILASPAADEPVHAARVALRRLRTLIRVAARARLFAPGATPGLGLIGQEIRRLNAALARARDWDVFHAETLAQVAAAQRAAAMPAEPSLNRLARAAMRARRAARQALAADLAGPGFARLLVALAVLTRSARALAVAEAEAVARTALARRWRRLRGTARLAGDDLAAAPAEALHRLRLDTKRLRYTAEAFLPLLPAKPARRALKRLAALQSALGHLNDGAVAAGLLATLPGQTRGGGLVMGFLAARGVAQRAALADLWRKCRRDVDFRD